MGKGIIQFVKDTIPKLGSSDPQWFRNQEEPDFQTVELGTEGPPMVLLHGLFGALSNWEASQPLFARYCRSIALSFPLLTAHRSEVKIKALSLYAEYFVRQRGLAPAVLCGNSLGGHVALRMYLAAPELVDCLILSGASGLYEHSVDTLPTRPDHKFLREHMLRVFYDPSFVTDEAVDEVYRIVTDRVKMLNLIHAARSAKRDNLQDLLGEIKAPTLLLWGEDDMVTTMDVAETFHKHIKNSELVTIKNCGHAPMIEHPEWFAEQVGRFLKQHSRHYKQPQTPAS